MNDVIKRNSDCKQNVMPYMGISEHEYLLFEESSTHNHEIFINNVYPDLPRKSRFKIHAKGASVYLTAKQIFILKHLAFGKTIKCIAQEICRSPRTIEDHIATIKEKTACYLRSELVQLYHDQLKHFF